LKIQLSLKFHNLKFRWVWEGGVFVPMFRWIAVPSPSGSVLQKLDPDYTYHTTLSISHCIENCPK
jgi:hypothetical protein